MTLCPPTSHSTPFWRRAARKVARTLAIPLGPITRRLRDRQAPRLHRYMMHEASVPMELTNKSALIVAPHADDETFGCGGVMALKTDMGASVHVMLITDGRQSHSHVAGTDVSQLVQTRNREMIEACRILGVPESRVHFLGLADQGLWRLSIEQRSEAVVHIVQLLNEVRPEELYINHRADRHPDHEATYALVAEAVARADVKPTIFEYPIWLLWKGRFRWNMRPRELRNARRVDVRAVQERKERAISVYASQLPVLPPGFVGQFRQGYEVFFRGEL